MRAIKRVLQFLYQFASPTFTTSPWMKPRTSCLTSLLYMVFTCSQTTTRACCFLQEDWPCKQFLDNERGEDGRSKIVETKAAIVRQIFCLSLQGYTAFAISERLTEEAPPPPAARGNGISPQSEVSFRTKSTRAKRCCNRPWAWTSSRIPAKRTRGQCRSIGWPTPTTRSSARKCSI